MSQTALLSPCVKMTPSGSCRLARDGVYLFVGAGASVPLGFPSGGRLLKAFKIEIENACESYPKACRPSPREIDELRLLIASSSTSSIDDLLLEAHNRDLNGIVSFGRHFIDHRIITSEQRLVADQGPAFVSPWITKLLDYFTEGTANYEESYSRIRPLDASSPGIDVNTLNYDRVLEHSLMNWFLARYPASESEIRSAWMGPALVRHHHGSLGTLAERPFGEPRRNRDPILKFWFERSNKAERWDINNKLIKLRKNLVVLGFGYHDLIVTRFDRLDLEKRVYLTAFDGGHDKRVQRFLIQLGQPNAYRTTGEHCIMESIDQLITDPQ